MVRMVPLAIPFVVGNNDPTMGFDSLSQDYVTILLPVLLVAALHELRPGK